MPMLPDLKPDDLIVFYIAAREKNLSSAAEKLFLSQPAVTYHIQSLEKYARVKLLEFKRRQIILTPHGKELLKYAEAIYQQLVDAERYIRFVREANLRVGIASVFDTIIGPYLPVMFEVQNPEARLMIKSGNAFEMVQDVINSELDLAIVPEFDYGSDKISHIQVSNPEKIVCFTAPRQRLPAGPLGWKELRRLPLVSGPDTSVIRRVIFEKFRAEGLEEPELAAEVGNVEWCKTLVENGKGMSFTLERDIQSQVAEGRFKLVTLKEYPYITAESVTRTDVANPIINDFVDVAKKAFNYNI
jgi:DNA-binding transcriptional LysR family regulator